VCIAQVVAQFQALKSAEGRIFLGRRWVES
jgi:hypothetical protein